MNKFLTPPTSAALSCERRQPGLLGSGQQGFAGKSAMDFYMQPGRFAGLYATDDYTAAVYLVHQLSSRDEQMSPDEFKSAALLLRKLLQKLKSATNVSVEALQSLQQAAEKIPVIGPLMFSAGNLPGTVATAAGGVMAAAQSRKVSDFLDITAEQKAKLNAWANSRGAPGAQSARRTFKGSIKIISKEGQLFFEIPVTAVAKHYKILDAIGPSVAHVPVKNTSAALGQRAQLHAQGATGVLKHMGSNTVGVALAVGPQAYLDYSSSTTNLEFYNKSVYSQPTNIVSAGFGVGTGYAMAAAAAFFAVPAAPLVVVIAVSFGVGLVAQWVMVEFGIDKKIGKLLEIEKP
ncbi:hypothetical protein RYA99_27300 [Pseudomonas syringae pv. actinidifoliorum]|nr:hypothetical protein [Pseudomonas syringae pv. actinidifoliorum]MDU8524170.1 hypothetical protein [Pseudomonas syringae pv. actinidifoliorum]MDU8529861.1 hypothetical protein [Pseudomonas syringae pv. actinidifoliorum]